MVKAALHWEIVEPLLPRALRRMGLDQGDGDGEVDPYSLQLFNTLWKESMRADGGETNNGSRVWLHDDDQGVP